MVTISNPSSSSSSKSSSSNTAKGFIEGIKKEAKKNESPEVTKIKEKLFGGVPAKGTSVYGEKVSTSTSRRGGGSGGESITPETIYKVQEVAKQEQIKRDIQQTQKSIESQKALERLGVATQQSSIKEEIFGAPSQLKYLKSQQKSVAPADLGKVSIEEIERRSTKNILGQRPKDYIEPKVAEKIISQKYTAEINKVRERDLKRKADYILEQKRQEIANFQQTELNDAQKIYSYLQDKVNSGEMGVEEANKRLKEAGLETKDRVNQFIDKKNTELQKEIDLADKEWQETRGKQLEKQLGTLIGSYRGLVIAKSASIPKVASVAGVGVATSVVAGVGLGLLGATAGAETASVVGTGLGIGTGILATGATGARVYNLYQAKITGKISKDEFTASLATGGAYLSAGVAGAMAGGLIVKAITDYSYLNKEEQKIANRLLERESATKITTKKGYLTEAEVRALKLSATEKAELLAQIKTGNSIQKVRVELNDRGLTPAELKVMKKLNFKGTGYQVVSKKGDISYGGSLYETSAGRGIARIDSGLKREVTSVFKGKAEAGLFKGIQYTEVKQPSVREKIIKIGGEDLSIPIEKRLELIKSAGKTKYLKEGESWIRVKAGQTKTKLIGREVFKGGELINTDIKSPLGTSKAIRISRAEAVSLGLDVRPPYAKATKKVFFKDVASVSYAGQEPKPLFTFEKTSSRVMKGFGADIGKGDFNRGTGAVLETRQVLDTTLITPKPEGALLTTAKSSLSGLSFKSQFSAVIPIQRPIETTKLIEPTETKRIEKQKLTQELGLIPKQKESTYKSVLAPKQISIMKEQERTLIIPKQTAPLIEKVKPKEESLISQIQPFPFQSTITTELTAKPIFPNKWSSGIGVGGGEKGAKKRTGIFGGTTYTPSLGSVLLRTPKKKVTKAQLKALGKKTYSGLGLRPQVEVIENRKGLFD